MTKAFLNRSTNSQKFKKNVKSNTPKDSRNKSVLSRQKSTIQEQRREKI